MNIYKITVFWVLIFCIYISKAQNNSTNDTLNTFDIGAITIDVSKNKSIENIIEIDNFQNTANLDVASIAKKLPGLHLTVSGGRNETMLNIRGFDLRQIPLYIDGIPVYVPYDGYVDLARFLSNNISTIFVSKGFSSVIFCPNSMGGAINLVSKKPSKIIEIDAQAGILDKQGYKTGINFGSNIGKIYFSASYFKLNLKDYNLSNKFDSTKFENGGNRENSFRFDQKIDFKIGFAPNYKHEYVVGFQKQNGKKGNPVYCGNDSLNSFFSKARYWQWPNWDKQTVYFLSKTYISDKNYIKTRIFYDNFFSLVKSFDDNTYSSQTKPTSFNSFYKDNSLGFALEFVNWAMKNNKLKATIQFKQDKHSEYNNEEPARNFTDNIYTIAFEDLWQVVEKFSIITGLSVSRKDNLLAQDFNKNTNEIIDFETSKKDFAYNYQTAFFYEFNSQNIISLSVSHKTRFATLKDRYSYRLGKSVPNPFLKPEKANNFDFNYNFYSSKIHFGGSIFYSKLFDVIVLLDNAIDNKSQSQNIGEAKFYGFDADFKYYITHNFSFEANYSFIERKNITNTAIYFTDVPKHSVYGIFSYSFLKNFIIFSEIEYNSDRYSTSYGTIAKSFWIMNAGININFFKYIYINAGLNNIFDKNYELVEGYPMQGRNFFVCLRVKI